MGVYIKGMEMPENCYRCLFFRMTNEWNKNDEANILFRCARTGEETWDYNGGYLPNCPLVPVPPHGDLIERDALRASIRESIEECHKWADEVDKDTMMYARISQSLGTFVECSLRVKAAPTIIPAEEGE